MKGAGIEKGAGFHERALVGIPALMLGAAAISSAATQFVAYRVGYHPVLGCGLVRAHLCTVVLGAMAGSAMVSSRRDHIPDCRLDADGHCHTRHARGHVHLDGSATAADQA
jgi:hypothetical protein